MKSVKGIFIAGLFFALIVSCRAADSITVYIFLLESCQICQNQTAELNKIHEEFKSSGILFSGIFPNQEMSSQDGIDSFRLKYNLKFPLNMDQNQEITEKYRATITPEVLVVRNVDQQILYRGKIDNSYERVGIRRSVTTEFYLREALQQILNNEPLTVLETVPVGCFIMPKS